MQFLLFIIQTSFSKTEDLPDTKHLEGGIFGWTNVLVLQRKIWSFLPIPVVRFDESDINITKITKEIISGKFDFNISSMIQDIISSIQETMDSDSDNETTNEEYFKLLNLVDIDKNQPISKIFGLNHVLEEDDDSYEENSIQCSKDKYPNAYFLSQMFTDGFINISNCSVIDEFIGQILSYAFIIVPIVIIAIFSILFYIIFCFCRCCCCRAKDRFGPGKCSIVCFVVVLLCLLASLGFSIASSTYTYKMFDYVVSKKILDEAETACNMINPSLGDGLKKASSELLPAISNISNQTVKAIDDSLPQLMDILNSTIDNIMEISSTMSNLVDYGEQITDTCSNSEDKFNQCVKLIEPTLQGECQNTKLPEISIIRQYTDFNSARETVNNLNSYLSNISNVIDVSSFINTGKDSLITTIDTIHDSISKLDDVNPVSSCDFHDYLEFFDELPSFIIPALKFGLFILPLFMFILIVFQFLTFLTKTCCSRCLSSCCIPCCLCTFCHLIIGLLSTLLLLLLIFTDLFSEQGDDVLDVLLKEVTNDDKVVDFGSLNLSSVSQGVIGSFPLDSIKLKKIHFIRNFLYADLDSKLSTIMSMSELPFDDMAAMIESALVKAADTTNLDGLIVEPMKQTINETQSSLPDSDLSEIADMDEMRIALEVYERPVKMCYTFCEDQYSELTDNYGEFFANFTIMRNTFGSTKEKIAPVLDGVPQNVSVFANDLFGGLLRTMGKTVGETLRLIIPVFDNVDMKWLIGLFNIFRVRFAYNFFSALICLSISAHLFIVGMTAMSLLIWIRRKGMAKKKKESSEDEDTESVDESEKDKEKDDSASKKDQKKKEKKEGSRVKRAKVQNADQDDSQPRQNNKQTQKAQKKKQKKAGSKTKRAKVQNADHEVP